MFSINDFWLSGFSTFINDATSYFMFLRGERTDPGIKIPPDWALDYAINEFYAAWHELRDHPNLEQFIKNDADWEPKKHNIDETFALLEDVKKKLNAPIPDFSELKTNENIKTLVLANVTLTTLCKELHDDGDLITYLINLDAARVMLQELCSLLRNYTIVDPSDPV